MGRKVCRKCGQEKDFAEFHKYVSEGPRSAWNLRYCSSCVSKENHERYMRRYQSGEGRKSLLESSRNWKKRNPEKHAALAREYRLRHPEKIIAQNRLNYAIRKGRIQRKPCEICGCVEKVNAHHVSYEPKDWYNVKWLCPVCHEIEHG